MRKLLAILFLVIFCCQVLPVRTLGKLLSKAQAEEEVKHGCDNNDDGGAGKYLDLINHTHPDFAVHYIPVKSAKINWHYADDLPAAHIADIPSPPPNC